MPVESDAAGRELGERTTSVTVRQILAYAAGLGVDDPRFYDDTDPALAALPQFCVSLEWPVVSDPRARQILGLTPEETRRGVHVSQDSTFHAPIRPDATVRTAGRVVEVRRTSAGALVRVLLESTEASRGTPLVTSWSASIYRGVGVEGPDRAVAEAPAVPRSIAANAVDLEEVEIPIARGFAHVYTECAAIWNPIHTERRVASAAGLSEIIVHGTATWALAGLAVASRLAGGDVRRLRRLAAQFRAPLLPGSTLAVRFAVAGDRDDSGVVFEARSREQGTVVAAGWAELASGPS